MGTAVSEAERVAELYAYADPDEAQSDEVEDLVARAAEVAAVPMATLNLLDTERQCQVATSGFAGSTSPRRDAMCNVALELGAFVHVPDASQDPRFAHSPWVDGRLGDVRFYASAPLRTPRGHVIGTLCVFDVEPHRLDGNQVVELQSIADAVVASFGRARSVQG